jgi:predicted MFS family arabinose efflux permease
VAGAVSALVSAAYVLRIRTNESRVAPIPASRVFSEIGAGIRVVLENPTQRSLVAAATTANFASAMVFASGLFVVYATRELGFSPAALGFIVAGGGGGFVLGALLAPAIIRRFGLGITMIALLAIWGTSYFTLPLARGTSGYSAALLGAGYFVGALAFSAYSIVSVSVQQAITPPSFLGRVTGVSRTATWGVLPLGALLGGALSEVVGLRAVLVIAAAGIAVSSAWLAASPLRAWSSLETMEATS